MAQKVEFAVVNKRLTVDELSLIPDELRSSVAQVKYVKQSKVGLFGILRRWLSTLMD